MSPSWVNRKTPLLGGISVLLIMWYGIWSYSCSLTSVSEGMVGIISLTLTLLFGMTSVWCFKQYSIPRKILFILVGISLLTSMGAWTCLSWKNWSPLQCLSPTEELRIVLESETNLQSLGHEVWFESLFIDGQPVSLSEWIQHEGWFKVESAYAPHDITDAVLTLKPIKGKVIEFNWLKTPYSGKITLYRNQEIIENFDLYSDDTEVFQYRISPKTGALYAIAKFGMAMVVFLTQFMLLVWGYQFSVSLYSKRQDLKGMLDQLIQLLQRYRLQIAMLGFFYGILTWMENLTPFSLLINIFLTLILLGMTKWLWNISRFNLESSPSRVRRGLPILALILYIGLRQNQWWILHPIDELVRPYELTVTATGEKSEDSMGTEVWISKILINGDTIPLSTLCESGQWVLHGDAMVNSQSPATLSFSQLRGEQVVVEFMNSAYSGNANVSRSESLIQTIDLHRTLSTYVQCKVTPDYFFLLGFAKISVWAWITCVLMACCVMISSKIQVFFSRYSSSFRQSKVIQWTNDFLNQPVPQKICRLLKGSCPQNCALHFSLSHWGYIGLPLLLIAIFRYLGHWTFQSEWGGYVTFFIGAVILERIAYRIWKRRAGDAEKTLMITLSQIIFYSIWWSLLLTLVLALIYHMPDLDVAWFWMETKVEAIIMVVSLLLSLIGVGYAITHHAPLTIGVIFTTFCCLGIADYFKRLVAGEPLYPIDLVMVTKLETLISFLNGVSPTFVFGALIVVAISLVILAYFVRGPQVTWKIRGVILFTTGIYAASFFNYGNSFLKDYVKGTTYIETWNQIQNYDDNGVVIGFISNLQNDSMIKPDNYSQKTIESIVQKRIETLQLKSQASTSERPNIVVILSESLSDPLQMNQLSFSEDPIPTIREYQSKGISGNFLSPFKGGSTSNVEFEFLTSLTNLFLTKGSVPFQQRLSTTKDFPSMVSYLNGLGYTSVAIHPSNPSFYKRNKVYPNLGFETFIGIDEMTYTERIANQTFVSDESMMNELLQVLKTQSDPAFVYGLTIQNHLPLEENKFGPTTIQVVDGSGERVTEMETYAQGVKLSDDSLKYFLEEIENFDEPTVVVFFGDHLINFESSIHQDHGYSYGDTNADIAKLFYQTPLFIWANEDLLSPQSVTSISPNFLAPLIVKALNLPMTPYYQLLLEIYEEFGALHRNFKLDREEKMLTTLNEEQQALLLEYELIQYDLLQGKGYALEKMFPPIAP